MLIISILGSLRQEDYEVKSNLGYTARTCHLKRETAFKNKPFRKYINDEQTEKGK